MWCCFWHRVRRDFILCAPSAEHVHQVKHSPKTWNNVPALDGVALSFLPSFAIFKTPHQKPSHQVRTATNCYLWASRWLKSRRVLWWIYGDTGMDSAVYMSECRVGTDGPVILGQYKIDTWCTMGTLPQEGWLQTTAWFFIPLLYTTSWALKVAERTIQFADTLILLRRAGHESTLDDAGFDQTWYSIFSSSFHVTTGVVRRFCLIPPKLLPPVEWLFKMVDFISIAHLGAFPPLGTRHTCLVN